MVLNVVVAGCFLIKEGGFLINKELQAYFHGLINGIMVGLLTVIIWKGN